MQLLLDVLPSSASWDREDELCLSDLLCDAALNNQLGGTLLPDVSLEGEESFHARACALNKDTINPWAHDVDSAFNETLFPSHDPSLVQASARPPLTQRRFKRGVLPPELSAVMDLDEAQILSYTQFGACNRSSKSLLHLGLFQTSESLIEQRLTAKSDILASLAGFYYVYLHHGGALRWRSALGVGRALMILGHDAFAHHYFQRIVKSKCSSLTLKQQAMMLARRCDLS
ncbi:MAG: hypothetical protein C0514_01765 [Candidatus Puniceispirillum sp.]|nr:hypothetical protein [Candidatus Puniceispirillum sp.]